MRPVRGWAQVAELAGNMGDDGELAFSGALGRASPARPLGGEDVEAAFEVVGDGSEADLGGGAGQTSPSHPTQPIAAFPGAEDLLDPGTDPMDRGVPGIQLGQGLLFVTAPHCGRGDPRRATLGPNRIAEMRATVGAVSKHLAGIIRQGVRKLSHMALSYASPTEPIDGLAPASLQRLPKATDVYCDP